MYGDPQRLRADAQVLGRAGTDLGVQATALVDHARTTTWQSCAADAMRRRMGEDAALLDAVAAEVADAATAMDRHAVAVAAEQARIAAVERSVRALALHALHAATTAAAVLPGGDDLVRRLQSLIARFPARGALEWLELPGQLSGLGATGGG